MHEALANIEKCQEAQTQIISKLLTSVMRQLIKLHSFFYLSLPLPLLLLFYAEPIRDDCVWFFENRPTTESVCLYFANEW